MGNIIQRLKDYLVEVLSVKVKIEPWKNERLLPVFLSETYDFYTMRFFKKQYLLVVAKASAFLTPAQIKMHFEQLQKITKELPIFVDEVITSYNRKRLIEQPVPFVIPGNQMYLPELAIDLREHFSAAKIKEKSLSPATQAVLIYVLMNPRVVGLTPSKLSNVLGYTTMTISRAFNEMESEGFGNIVREGKERVLSFKEEKKELWEKIKDKLHDPVKKRVWVKGVRPELFSGCSALAKTTMLAAPVTSTYAVSLQMWKKMDVRELPYPEDEAFEVEIWEYDPSLFADKKIVDPFSLYLSLKEVEDERVEIALEELMEKVVW